MKLAIMQPYFLPYIGYYQLMAAVDTFVVYDNIKYTKKGWINRNRILLNGTDETISLPLKNDSDALDVVQRELAVDYDRGKLLNKLTGAYRGAPYYARTFPLLERIVRCEETNLFRYIHHSITEMCTYLDIGTDIRISSSVNIDHSLRAQDKVIALCQALGAGTYINAMGGMELYKHEDFAAHELNLKFIKTNPFEYAQFGTLFMPWLSIIDVLMFCARDDVIVAVHSGYDLVGNSHD